MDSKNTGQKKLESILEKLFEEAGISLQYIDNTRDEDIERELGIKRKLGESAGFRTGCIPLPTPPEEKIRRNMEIALSYGAEQLKGYS